jgi:hypothetical protein
MSKRALLLGPFLALVLAQVACGARSWQPPPPYGTTYQYDFQGFRSTDTTVVAGTSGGFPAYGAAFAFRDAKGVHEEEGGKDPFTQSAPIDGITFNAHLQGQGARLGPGSSLASPTPAGEGAPRVAPSAVPGKEVPR